VTNDSAFDSFLRIVNNKHSNLGSWYSDMQLSLRPNEKLYLKFVLTTGLRKAEAQKPMALIIKLFNEGKLYSYYNSDLQMLEHWRFPQLFFRKTKMVYFSIVPKELVAKIANSKPVSYYAIRKRAVSHKQTLRIKELRSFYLNYLRKHGILPEIADLIHGRVSKEVMVRNYTKIADMKS
jgi:intergrase/recombinase